MNNKDSAYAGRGVSASKDEVHSAIANVDKGLFPGAFCKMISDPCGDDGFCALMHADGAGTKSALAYMYYKETGEEDVFSDIAQDSLIMNIDDLLCVGATGGFVVSNTIGRNAHRIPGSVIKRIIGGYEECADILRRYGIDITLSGGETADVGDLVRTVIADSTVFCRLRRTDVIDCSDIRPGNVIVGLASSGKAVYEKRYNAGMGSNGLTAARHLLFSSVYRDKYPETFSPTIERELVYCGKYLLTDELPGASGITVGRAVLSPTRTYAPLIKSILDDSRRGIYGIIHCSGGAQVKCRSFGRGLKYVKDSLFDLPPLFETLSKCDISRRELYNVFNCGHRAEIYCDGCEADRIIASAESFGIDAKVIGHVEASDSDRNKVLIVDRFGQYEY
ncbi:MAG: AIR synthase-related protein [Oscillospiraceae bacterium]|nr:AIR synthase-related protein [Oscillospiraceae bacterium]